MITQLQMKKKILSDRYNALVFRTGKEHDIFLVGGYIRDLMRGFSSRDRDFIVGKNIDAFIRKMKLQIPGTVITFKKGQVARFALKSGICFDFTQLRATLQHDLSQRDFTMNAIAWSPDTGLIDLHHGIRDIRKRVVRAISSRNILSDPLRILRAYRFAAEIQGTIERNTRNIIKSMHYRLKDASPERITLELFYLLNQNCSAKYLKIALNDMVLSVIFPLNSSNLKTNIQSVSEFECRTGRDSSRASQVSLKRIFSQSLIYKGLLCLEILITPYDYTTLKGTCLRMSKAIVKRLSCFSKGIESLKQQGISRREKLFHVFFYAKDASPDVLIAKNMTSDMKHYRRYKSLWQGGQISTDMIKRISGLEGGMALGNIIREVRKAEFLEEIRTVGQANKFIQKRYNDLAENKNN